MRTFRSTFIGITTSANNNNDDYDDVDDDDGDVDDGDDDDSDDDDDYFYNTWIVNVHFRERVSVNIIELRTTINSP